MFEYYFNDESFEWMYRHELRMAQTVADQSIKAALADPVKSLCYE